MNKPMGTHVVHRSRLGWLTALLGAGALALGLAVVWLNIERLDLAYEIKQLRSELESKSDLQAKLEVERMNLLSSSRMRDVARETSLKQANPGQIRVLSP
jgi:cell division protein FtsL